MNLQENINRIKQVMGLTEQKIKYDLTNLTPANPKSPLYHSTSYKNRDNILKNGLTPRAGGTHTSNYSHNVKNGDIETIPLIWAKGDSNIPVYGGDVWEIDLTKSNVKWYLDPIHQNDERLKENLDYVTPNPIPASAIKLISSDEQRDDDAEVYSKTGVWPNREPISEPKQDEPDKWDDMLNQLGDDDLGDINLEDL
jgi:hypothetical protein